MFYENQTFVVIHIDESFFWLETTKYKMLLLNKIKISLWIHVINEICLSKEDSFWCNLLLKIIFEKVLEYAGECIV